MAELSWRERRATLGFPEQLKGNPTAGAVKLRAGSAAALGGKLTTGAVTSTASCWARTPKVGPVCALTTASSSGSIGERCARRGWS